MSTVLARFEALPLQLQDALEKCVCKFPGSTVATDDPPLFSDCQRNFETVGGVLGAEEQAIFGYPAMIVGTFGRFDYRKVSDRFTALWTHASLFFYGACRGADASRRVRTRAAVIILPLRVEKLNRG